MKKRGLKIKFILIAFVLFLSGFLIIAATTPTYLTCPTENCIKIYHGSTIDLTYNSVCKTISNTHVSNDYFIPPTTRGTDYSTFLSNPPVGISITSCAVVAVTTTYSGNGCDSCPFGSTEYATLGGYPYDTECNKNGNQVRFKYPSGVWETWSYTALRPCKEKNQVSCGLSCTEVKTTNFDWEMKP